MKGNLYVGRGKVAEFKKTKNQKLISDQFPG